MHFAFTAADPLFVYSRHFTVFLKPRMPLHCVLMVYPLQYACLRTGRYMESRSFSSEFDVFDRASKFTHFSTDPVKTI